MREMNGCLKAVTRYSPSWLVLVNVGFAQLWLSVCWWHLLGWIRQPTGETKPNCGWKKGKTFTVFVFRALREELPPHLCLCLILFRASPQPRELALISPSSRPAQQPPYATTCMTVPSRQKILPLLLFARVNPLVPQVSIYFSHVSMVLKSEMGRKIKRPLW